MFNLEPRTLKVLSALREECSVVVLKVLACDDGRAIDHEEPVWIGARAAHSDNIALGERERERERERGERREERGGERRGHVMVESV